MNFNWQIPKCGWLVYNLCADINWRRNRFGCSCKQGITCLLRRCVRRWHGASLQEMNRSTYGSITQTLDLSEHCCTVGYTTLKTFAPPLKWEGFKPPEPHPPLDPQLQLPKPPSLLFSLAMPVDTFKSTVRRALLCVNGAVYARWCSCTRVSNKNEA